MSDREAQENVQVAFALWEQRSAIAWELDLSILSGLGIRLAAPAADATAGIGQARLQQEPQRPW